MRNLVFFRAVAVSGCVAVALGAAFSLANLWAVSAYGISITPWVAGVLAIAYICGVMVAIFTVPVALLLIVVRLILRRSLGKAPQRALSAFVFVIVSFSVARNPHNIAVREVAEQGAPLIDAIRRFETTRGTPPATLSELVPEYLPSIPTTGIRLAPEYEYRVGSDARCDNPWMLSHSFPDMLPFPLSPISTDFGCTHYYLPRGNYLDKTCLGNTPHTEVMFGWAVVGF